MASKQAPKQVPKHILVVEDDADIADLLKLHLEDSGAVVRCVQDGTSAWSEIQRETFDLAVLDLRLPGIDGVELCRRLRAAGNRLPILMLTAKSSELDRVLGLEIGADDYVTKPFSVMEVMARIRALLRRVEMEQHAGDLKLAEVIRFSGLVIDRGRREVCVGDAPVELTAREFDLLAFFALHPGTVFKRAQLLDNVWGYGHEGYEHTVNSHINRLRAKIQPKDQWRFIETVWGVGYRFSAPGQDVA